MIKPGTPKKPTIKADNQLTATPKPIYFNTVKTIKPIKALIKIPTKNLTDFPTNFKTSKTTANAIANTTID